MRPATVTRTVIVVPASSTRLRPNSGTRFVRAFLVFLIVFVLNAHDRFVPAQRTTMRAPTGALTASVLTFVRRPGEHVAGRRAIPLEMSAEAFKQTVL